jgi:hypothetical protein
MAIEVQAQGKGTDLLGAYWRWFIGWEYIAWRGMAWGDISHFPKEEIERGAFSAAMVFIS